MFNDSRHKSKNYFIVRKVVRLVFWGALLAGVYYIATHLNWVGDGYCWGTMDKCYLGGE